MTITIKDLVMTAHVILFGASGMWVLMVDMLVSLHRSRNIEITSRERHRAALVGYIGLVVAIGLGVLFKTIGYYN